MSGALIIAALFECAGALIAGSDVVKTISEGIVDPSLALDPEIFLWMMMSALLASAIWVHLATFLGAPVSTTHAIVGAVIGAGVAALGTSIVDWTLVMSIIISWVLSPLLGGVIAALFLALIKVQVIYQDDKIAAARRWVPALVSFMAATFSAYLILKGLKNVWRPAPHTVAAVSALIFAVVLVASRWWIVMQSTGMENRNQSLRTLFHLPLICSAALLSFAHGSNDVANAVGPLAAILQTANSGAFGGEIGIPFWLMLIGAVGISLVSSCSGRALFASLASKLPK